ncbi:MULTISPECIES: hypothetical protein [Acinetobacter calcoaceticus/baumannii complex]|uniref:hypothetical protein n=1 Tax=Acinetobacter calcoaceticus/baumannii complex TaxID=909768 RepID=UPI000D36FAE1|nr:MULTISPECIES: hypothetical protein [Acinetobacter calcoaceticus/baumannii complex]ELA7825218.1 hypothetical protein [Acinetobacter baumannii]MBR7737377.1 hypothetical protein [Acinetobacter nosocomialis]MDC5395734.1 hypothetical protein [Acinetobacter baumannii]
MKLIIDADIMRSAGTSEHPVSSTSRNLLIKIKDEGLVAVYCPTLMQEWKKHRSNYARQWIVAMVSRKKLALVNVNIEAKLFLESLADSKAKDIALKDAHLVDLAIATDKIIFSNDLNAKDAFSKLLDNRDNFNNIYWLSPKIDMDIILENVLKNKKIYNVNKTI